MKQDFLQDSYKHPFCVAPAQTGVYVYPGLVFAKTSARELGVVTPTLGGSAMVDVFTSTTAPTLLAAGAGVVYLKCRKHSEYVVDEAEVLKGASLPADDATHFYVELATVTADFRVTQVVTGHIYAVSGGSDGWWPFKATVVDVVTGVVSFPFAVVGTAPNSSTWKQVSIGGVFPTPGNTADITLPVTATQGLVWLQLDYTNDGTTGEMVLTTASLGAGNTLPTNTSSSAYFVIGWYSRPVSALVYVEMFYSTHLIVQRHGPSTTVIFSLTPAA